MELDIGTPQVISIILYITLWIFSAAMHGKEKEGTHNFHIDTVAMVLGIALLYWGGYWT